MVVIMIMDGVMTPRVAKMPPQKPFSFKPMKVATFTAIIPGVTCPRA